MKKARITAHPEYKIGEVDPRLYGGYLEPIGNWVYGGVWNPDHPAADDMGFRGDMLAAIRELGIPTARLPGGNVVSGWDWRDSIGPKANRRARLDMAWRQIEPNTVGHDEYLEWARRAGVEALYTLNLGTGDISGAMECVDYTVHPGGTYWSELRRRNGYDKPHGVKTWYLGNEPDGPWEIASYEKDPVAYGIKAHEIAKAVKWIDPTAETVAAGSSSPLNATYPDWDARVLEQCYETADYLSVHYYHNAPEGDVAAFLNASSVFEDFIRTTLASCDFVQAKLRHPKQMPLSFDEYGVAFRPQGEVATGRPGYVVRESAYGEFSPDSMNRPYRVNDPSKTTRRGRQGNEMLGALGLGSVMLTLLRHADRIKIGCMTGAIGGAIAYDRDSVWKAAAYHPLKHLLTYGQGSSILPVVQGPTFDAPAFNLNGFHQAHAYENVPCVEAACAAREEDAAVFLINRSPEPIGAEVDIRGFVGMTPREHIALADDGLRGATTAENPGAIAPVSTASVPCDKGIAALTLKPYSWNVLRLSARG